jgi:hypothetical protein
MPDEKEIVFQVVFEETLEGLRVASAALNGEALVKGQVVISTDRNGRLHRFEFKGEEP